MQGFNMGRYVPPDVEGTTSANALHKKHALGSRASKLSSGILTVRFEMPFAVWCSTCPKPTIIGQGVRFNVEKKKVGQYHSTPVYSFRMRHVACGGTIEIRTDPKNTAYVVVEGGRKRDTGDDRAVADGEAVAILTEGERAALRTNAFAKLERTIEDREQAARAKARVEELEDESARRWEDPYALNRKMRDVFRVGRKQREKEGLETEALRERMGLGIELLPGTEEDSARAKLVDFGDAGLEDAGDAGGKALAKPLFNAAQSGSKLEKPDGVSHGKKKKLKTEIAAAQMRESLVSEIVGNTRASQDPFLAPAHRNGDGVKISSRIPGIKRKRSPPEKPHAVKKQETEQPNLENNEATQLEGHGDGTSASTALVEYDSD
ncbi:CWC16 protein [Xylariaceae sp. FL0016]|nr:CWC16 protein [Xylariaceae sp. FL0016]